MTFGLPRTGKRYVSEALCGKPRFSKVFAVPLLEIKRGLLVLHCIHSSTSQHEQVLSSSVKATCPNGGTQRSKVTEGCICRADRGVRATCMSIAGLV